MKKLLFILLALPLLATFTACSDDDDMPQVNIDITYGNTQVVNGDIYVVQPDTFKITAITVTAAREGHKATNGPVSYFLNAVPLGTNPVMPYGIDLPTDNLKTGAYVLQIYMPIYEEGCELASAFSQVNIHVVADAADIPADATPSTGQRVDHTFE
ncbi:MAG: hypothetical protein NC338_01845 [Firmicutes bacterium]|nr:hypothetical protein [Bacillota bacterium]MCM1401217.1 hypothetical protein [Bacteroides sp.]MCM1477086.1 hypothetical protein [Bacteroides sp.]